ncbi:hypothetical protein HYH02_008884 [Chlamydomonas schloesseri]|uniref:Uncharacterized protein n=1 Tax=Chlamydomonas schloesseri TaxID=2026947 RepID=A0A835WCS7_9CHLO|nr:hypothetical protein HYH02_008884 [Chlamydomonas schloesseri]|eukprot:KAG2445016.1 hypothetical protein HYH02_008884 [Chlamydomonas schloesseri]
MILQHTQALNSKRIILASGSPRRRELLGNIGLKFEVLVSSFDEKLPKDRFPGGGEYALETARHKALDVAGLVSEPVDLIISADTVVESNGVILEKPDDDEHAFAMISSLSGREHQVHTGVVLVLPQEADPATGSPPLIRSFVTTTHVTFDSLPEEAIRAYIATGEPFGKAGSYGIQGAAGAFVSGLRGCYFNVVGFPLHRFCSEISALIKEGKLKL